MLRLMIDKRTLEEKKALYRALCAAMHEASFGPFRERKVDYELSLAADWLYKQLEKEDASNAQNR